MGVRNATNTVIRKMVPIITITNSLISNLHRLLNNFLERFRLPPSSITKNNSLFTEWLPLKILKVTCVNDKYCSTIQYKNIKLIKKFPSDNFGNQAYYFLLAFHVPLYPSCTLSKI